MMKLRKTADRSVSSMLVEPPRRLKEPPSDDLSEPVRWRYMQFVRLVIVFPLLIDFLLTDKHAVKI